MGVPALRKVSTDVPSWEELGVPAYCSQVASTDIKEVGVATLVLNGGGKSLLSLLSLL